MSWFKTVALAKCQLISFRFSEDQRQDNPVQRRLLPLLPVTTDVLAPGVSTATLTGHDEGGQVCTWPFFLLRSALQACHATSGLELVTRFRYLQSARRRLARRGMVITPGRFPRQHHYGDST